MLYGIIFFAILVLDQVTKAIVDLNDFYKVPVIEKVLYITNTRNSGAAFGMMSDDPRAQVLFAILTSLSMIAIGVFVVLKKNDSKWLNFSLVFVASGAIGNFIDRITFKNVRDFLDVPFFANCNVADVAITVGGIMLVVYFLFLDQEAVFKKQKKTVSVAEEATSEVTDKTADGVADEVSDS